MVPVAALVLEVMTFPKKRKNMSKKKEFCLHMALLWGRFRASYIFGYARLKRAKLFQTAHLLFP